MPVQVARIRRAISLADVEITEKHLEMAKIALELHKKENRHFQRINAIKELMKDGYSLAFGTAAVDRALNEVAQ
ncbi:MAG: hypothetical protein Q8Q06_00915 [bacterium]|nr:hypothetical protein [bacterium]